MIELEGKKFVFRKICLMIQTNHYIHCLTTVSQLNQMHRNMKIIAFGASTSSTSINKTLAGYVAGLFKNFEKEIIDLNDFDVPIFSVDVEKKTGIPPAVIRWITKISEADLLIVSMAEHNGSYTAAFKNLMDWASRYVGEFWSGNKMFLLSTSPGKRGGKSVMDAAATRFPIHGAKIIDYFSLPSFNENFSIESGIIDENLKLELETKIKIIQDEFKLA